MRSYIKVLAFIAVLVVIAGCVFTGCMFFGDKSFADIFPNENTEEIDGSDKDFSKLY